MAKRKKTWSICEIYGDISKCSIDECTQEVSVVAINEVIKEVGGIPTKMVDYPFCEEHAYDDMGYNLVSIDDYEPPSEIRAEKEWRENLINQGFDPDNYPPE